MKVKFLSLGVIAAMAIASCQSDVSSESPQEVNEIQNSLKEKKHDVNKWHNGPDLIQSFSGRILHEAGAFQGALANCDTYAHYEGGEDLLAVYDAPQYYHGEIDVENILISDQLNICGTLNVSKQVKINHGGTLNMGGEMVTDGDVKINFGGHLVIEGNLIIKGDLVLHKSAVLRFLGDNSTIEVLGKAKIYKDAVIEGEFDDVSQKIK